MTDRDRDRAVGVRGSFGVRMKGVRREKGEEEEKQRIWGTRAEGRKEGRRKGVRFRAVWLAAAASTFHTRPDLAVFFFFLLVAHAS